MDSTRMKIKKAPETGFCSGVRRAIQMVEKVAANGSGPVWTIGPLVHNPQVISALEKKGVRPLKGIEDLSIVSEAKGQLVLPTHGLGTKELEAIKGKPIYRLHDGTCPIVGHLQKKAKKLSEEGYAIIIYGEAQHAEVKGLLGWSNGLAPGAMATTDLSELNRIKLRARRWAILSQTTQEVSRYIKFCQEILNSYLPQKLEIRIFNTVCPEVTRRQSAARELSRESDLIIIVGGRDSSNTRRLAEICQSAGVQVHLVESAEEIKEAWLEHKKCVGILAGTSTPEESVEEVEVKLKVLSRQ